MKTNNNISKTSSAMLIGKKTFVLALLIFMVLPEAWTQTNTNVSYDTNKVNISGNYSVAFGREVLLNNTAVNNSGFGYRALYSNGLGYKNTALGSQTLYSNTSGSWNTATGYNALYSNTTGAENTANGYAALQLNTTGEKNTAVGYLAANANTTGINNTTVGWSSLLANTTGQGNTAVGAECLRANTTGGFNAAFGKDALFSNTTGVNNSAFGYQSMDQNTTGYANAAFGARSLYNNTTGYYNTVSGYYAMYSNTTGYLNTAYGFNSLYTNSIGDYNTANGYRSLYSNTDGRGNTAVGFNALSTNTSGDYNSALGYEADVSGTGLNNATAIGYGAIANASNKIRFGNANVTVVEGPVAYTISDGRFKTNISESDVAGLDFIKRLRPVVYNFESRRFEEFLTKNMPDSIRNNYLSQDFTASTAIRQSGFIAQEVEAAAKASGYNFNGVHIPENDNDNYSLAYSQFVVPLVKGMQEQQQMIEQLQAEIQDLKNKITASADNSEAEPGTLNVFPNPARGLVTINIPAMSNGVIEIYTLYGKLVYSYKIATGTTVHSADLSAQAKGMYLVKFSSGGKTIATQKLIIE